MIPVAARKYLYYEEPGIVLLHGDCMEILPLLSPACVHVAITSPPYNLVRNWSGGGPNSNMKGHEAKQEDWYDDEEPEASYQERQKRIVSHLLRICKGSVFYNHKVRYAWKRREEIYHPLDWLRSFPIWCEIIWDRTGALGGNSQRLLLADERIYQIGRPHVFNGAMGLSNIWRFPPADVAHHVCAFPEELPRRCLLPFSEPGDIVLDPFFGSGTTALAAKNLGRKCIGIEIESKYLDIAIDRLRQGVLL